jgi:uncharacterized membrane protein
MGSLIGILAVIFFIGAAVLLFIFYNAFTWGYVVSLFYGWFVLSVFPTAPAISLIQFIGIMLFLIALLPKYHGTALKDEYENKKTKVIGLLIAPWLTLLFGWIIKITIM